MDEEAGRFCSGCGTAWFDEDAITPISTSAPSATTTTANPINTARATANPYAQAISRAPDRSSVAPTAHSVLKAAREGKAPTNTQALLPSSASTVTALYASMEDATFTIAGGTLKQSTDRPQGKRRDVTEFAHIAEAILHGLVASFFPDEEDICREAWGLLSIAIDIHRDHGFKTAHHYVDAVLLRRHLTQWQQQEAPNLREDRPFSMADFHPNLLQAAVLAKPAPRPSTTSGGPAGTPSYPCNNWNSGYACKQTPCPWQHTCKGCKGPHRLSDCPSKRGTTQDSQSGQRDTGRPRGQ